MRVLQLISSSGFGGAEAVVALLSAELAALDAEITVAVLHHPRSEPRDLRRALEAREVPVLDLPCAGRLDTRPLLHLVSVLRRNRINVLHTHGYKANTYGFLAARLAGCRLVATCHNWTDRTSALRRYRSLDLHLLRHFDRVVAVSASVAATMARHRFPHDRLTVIPNGIAVADSSVHGSPTEPAAPVIGAVARLSPEKGVDVLLRAFALLRAQQPGARCIVAGEGAERPALERLAGELGIASQLSLPGFTDNVPAFLRGCTVVVQPSRIEGLPIAVLEAMAAGRAIVATTAGDVPALLAHGEAGLLVSPDDPEALATAVLRLLRDPALRGQLGERAARAVREHYGAARMAGRYAELYEGVLASDVTRTERRVTPDGAATWERVR